MKRDSKIGSNNLNSLSNQIGSIELYEGVLKFNNRAAFDAADLIIQKEGKLDLPDEFISMASVFKKVLQEEDLFFAEYAKTHKPDPGGKAFVDVHSDFYKHNQNIFLLTKLNNGTTILEMNIFSSSIAELVNRDGLVIIDNIIYGYTKNSIYKCNKLDRGIIKRSRSIPYNNNFELILQVGTRIKSGFCSYCFKACYRYNTKVSGSILKEQIIVEFFLNQVHSGSTTTYCITDSKIFTRYRYLKINPWTGIYSTSSTTGVLKGQFAGPRSPSQYDNPNGYSILESSLGDKTVNHCTDTDIYGSTNCFDATHGAYEAQTLAIGTCGVYW